MHTEGVIGQLVAAEIPAFMLFVNVDGRTNSECKEEANLQLKSPACGKPAAC